MIKKIFICLFLVLQGFTSFSKTILPAQLFANWLSPKTNEWKFCFTDNYAIAEGKFWNYRLKSQKKNKLVLVLSYQKMERELFITLIDQNTIRIGNNFQSQAVYTKKYNEQPDFGNYERRGFQLPVIKPGSVHLSGVLNGYDRQKSGYQFISLNINGLLDEEQQSYPIKVDSLGRFELNFVLDNPQEVMLKYGDMLAGFYAVPGHRQMIAINTGIKAPGSFEEFLAFIGRRQDLLFMGQDALLNSEMNNFYPRIMKLMEPGVNKDKQGTLDQDSYKKYQLQKQKRMLNSLLTYSQLHHSSKKFSQYFKQFITYQIADDLLRYSWLNGSKYLSKDYLAFLKTLKINEQINVITTNYISVLRELSRGINLMSYKITAPSSATVIVKARALGYQLTPRQEELARKAVVIAKGLDTIFIQQEIEGIKDELLVRALYAGAKSAIDKQKEDNIIRFNQEFGITARSFVGKLLKAQVVFATITDKGGLSSRELSKAVAEIGSATLVSVLVRHNQSEVSKNSEDFPLSTNVLSAMAANTEQLLEKLVEKYKGKVVYVDFWAPWCGPCMGQMSSSHELKKELDGLDVVFLYLGVNCSEESWSKTIKENNITGEHYLLSKDEFTLLSGRFQIGGIPRYMLVDKQGKIVDENAKLPSQKMELLKEINVLVN
ncbi:TlpA family protein disulfide reductase [Pedobacter sp. HDW13]|uniref:TlpA family protein disulfide reductase n=1 Tax=Pedobacter sp. HDW13 TaxID=2714940 RepID=UPI0014072928|nr:TlpA disulfide reductase family protein [Pedobacter sp. HDW13]QIL42367.1 TlpA family protein disulfide reductase [Pedobacter sp. HDW13]